MAQQVKNLPVMQETWVRSLGWEDPLEEEMATTPVFLPGEYHGQRSLADHSPQCRKELYMTERLISLSLYIPKPTATELDIASFWRTNSMSHYK